MWAAGKATRSVGGRHNRTRTAPAARERGQRFRGRSAGGRTPVRHSNLLKLATVVTARVMTASGRESSTMMAQNFSIAASMANDATLRTTTVGKSDEAVLAQPRPTHPSCSAQVLNTVQHIMMHTSHHRELTWQRRSSGRSELAVVAMSCASTLFF